MFKEVVRIKKAGKGSKKRKLNGARGRNGSASGSEGSGSEEEEAGNEAETDGEEEVEAAQSKRMEMPEKDRASRYASRGTGTGRASSATASVATGTMGDDSGIGMNTTRGSDMLGSSQVDPRRRKPSIAPSEGDATMNETQEDESQDIVRPVLDTQATAVSLDPTRARLFRQRLATAMRGRFAEEEAFSKEALLPEINMGVPVEELFGSSEAELVLADMQEKNEIFFSEGIVYKL